MRYELGVFRGERELRGGSGIDSRNLVQKICQPHELVVVAEIEAEHRVVDNFVADIDFFGERFFGEMQEGGADI